MELLITKETLGAKHDLIVNQKGVHQRTNENSSLSNDTIWFPSSRYHEIRKLYGLDWRTFPPERFKKPYESLLQKKRVSLPWEKLIPQTIYQKELQAFIKALWEDLKDLDIEYFNNIFEKQTPLFYSLEKAAIDVQLYNQFMNTAQGTAKGAVLETFKPTRQTHGSWFAEPVEYDRISSITGRLKIRRGPGILHLKKDFRSCITSRFGEDGKVYYLDFKSLEPRLLLTIQEPNIKIPKDIYLYALKTMGLENEIDRKYIKTAIISMIYGAGDKELIRQLKPHVSYPEDFVSSVKERFGVEDLKEKLYKEYESYNGKMIYNHYKRPIFSKGTAPYVLVNHFIQSTAVDVALLGFSKIVDKLLKSDAIKFIKPLFVLHDALVLDVHNDLAHLLPKLANLGSIGIPKFEDAKFWIDIEQLSNTLDIV